MKGPWSPPEEGQALRFSEKSGRLPCCNQLSPDARRQPFAPEEDAIIVAAHDVHGNKGVTIARLLAGRTDNAVKNSWNSTLKPRLKAAAGGGPEEKRTRMKRQEGGGGAEGGSAMAVALMAEWDIDDPMTELRLRPPGTAAV